MRSQGMEEAAQLVIAIAGEDVPGRDAHALLEWLFETQRERLFRFALRMAANRDDALDLLQDAFARAAAHLARLPRNEHEATSWMFRTIVNAATDRFRRRRIRDAFVRAFRREEAHDPGEALIAGRAVHVALASLPPQQRAAVALCDLEGFDSTEAAEILNIAPATVRWHRAEAHKKLALILGADSP